MQRVIALIFLGALILFVVGFKGSFARMANGHQPKDDTTIQNDARLAHLYQALSIPNIQHAGEFLSRSDEYAFAKAPNPSKLLKAMQRTNSEREIESGIPLRVLSYNIALLNAKLLGFIDYSRSPYLEERRTQLPDLIFGQAHDVIFLQEVWDVRNVELFVAKATAHGYLAFVGPRTSYDDGLMTFVKISWLNGGQVKAFGSEPFVAQNPLEYFPGPRVQRGFHHVSVVHPQLGTLHFYNAHLLAWPKKWTIRTEQARELALHASLNTSDKEVVIMGGDMNSGPYYKRDDWTLPDGSPLGNWWKNAIAYALFLHYGDLDDLVVMGRSVDEADSDVSMADRYEGREPKQAWCKDMPKTTFSGTDCNELYRMQYEGTENQARLDQIFARDRQHRIKVSKSGLAFTEKMQFSPTLFVEPSDHYGVFVEMNIAPRAASEVL